MKLHTEVFLFLLFFVPHQLFFIVLLFYFSYFVETFFATPNFLTLLCVHKHAFFICKFTSPCSVFDCFSSCSYFISNWWFQHLSKSDKRGWL